MNGERELIDKYFESGLTTEEETVLVTWLGADREHMRVFIRETHLHRQLRAIMVARPFHVGQAASVVENRRSRFYSAIDFVVLALRRAWLPVTACVVLAMVAGIWFLFPTMGQPVLAEVHGGGLTVLRDGQSLVAFAGMPLHQADILRTADGTTAIIGFAPEATRVTLLPATELKLSSLVSGKQFTLDVGKLEASVARQRPFHPMILTTPPAQARVVGTRFTLTVKTNSTQLEVTEGKVRFTRLSDNLGVPVPAGYYAIAGANCDLTAMPFTGGLLREWWTGMKAQTMFDFTHDPRFPNRPDEREPVPDFEMTVAETNQFAVCVSGYLHPPVTGNYSFWLEQPPADFAKIGFGQLLMSPTENPAEAVTIALTGSSREKVSPYVTVGRSTAPPPIPLVAGRRYYIAAELLIMRGKGELSVAWQPPGQHRQLLSTNYLSPWIPNK